MFGLFINTACSELVVPSPVLPALGLPGWGDEQQRSSSGQLVFGGDISAHVIPLHFCSIGHETCVCLGHWVIFARI